MSEEKRSWFPAHLEAMIQKMFYHQQRQRYWRIARWSALLFLIGGITFSVSRQLQQLGGGAKEASAASMNKEHVAFIDLKGELAASFDTTIASTADVITLALFRAFSNPNVVAVVLRINSPGGNAVQSCRVFNAISQLRKKHPKVPIYAVCEEVCCSGGYHIASACNEIYANPHSIVGSIGVISSSFGYVKALQKQGIEYRLITSGENKSMLSPYSPLEAEHVSMLKEMQAEGHELFIADVKQGRGERIKVRDGGEKELFSGRYWTGTQALELGLIDHLITGGIDPILRRHKAPQLVNYTPQSSWLSTLFKHALHGNVGRQVSGGLVAPLMGLGVAMEGLMAPMKGLL